MDSTRIPERRQPATLPIDDNRITMNAHEWRSIIKTMTFKGLIAACWARTSAPPPSKCLRASPSTVTAGTDAQAEVTVRLEEAGRTVNGQGADTDTLVASARSYVNALNKLLVKREKTAPSALSA